jgi:hypothetical protein
MIDVLGLHGLRQQQQGRNQLLPRWQGALNDGVERAEDGPDTQSTRLGMR